MTSATIDEKQEILQGFIVECRELLEDSELQLIQLQEIVEESGDLDDEIMNTIFRAFHSIKGSAGLLNLDSIARVTHEAETLLDLFRQGKAQLESRHTDLLIRACDVIQKLLDNIETSSSDEGLDAEVKALTEELVAAQSVPPAPCPEVRADTWGQVPGVRGQRTEDRGQRSEDGSQRTEDRSQRIEDREQKTEGSQPATSNQQPATSNEQPSDEFQLTITPEMVKQFIQEADEILDTVEQSLLELEKDPDNRDMVDTAFRSVHSFKGNCGFLGYADLERLSHKMETVLGAMKSGAISAKSTDIGVLLKIVDMIRGGVADISNGQSGAIGGIDLTMRLMDEMLPESTDEAEPQRLGEILVARGDTTPEAVENALEAQNKPLGEILVDMGATTPDAVESALKQQAKQEERIATALQSGDKKVTRRDIRVDLDKLDNLINLVGELVIARAMVIHNPDLQGYEFENFEKAAHHLERVTADLQDVAMSVRMVPVSGVFRKMIRLVHDLSNKCDKKVHLARIGEETEVDKTVIEQISDPLVHIIRNSLDHGIEPAEERKACGKPETGTITLKAEHEGGEVLISVSDDGQGLDRDKILAKAIERGVVKGDGSDMRDEDIFKCIFEPGFSTAEKVTNVSGRGVGMDVVKKNIEHIKGRIDIHSRQGQGTTIVMRIPLTLAIIDGMLVRVGQQRYTLPLLAIKESFRPTPSDITVTPDGQEVVRNHGELLPVVRLHTLYNVHADHTRLDEGILVTVDHQEREICLLVDEVLGQQQTVIKRLSDYYVEDARGVSGCTILGDGAVSLILDIKGLVEKAKN
jgi:two-component system chemotaxis sensor kinase CheA